MHKLSFSKEKASALFEAYRSRTGMSYAKISLKLGLSAGYLASVLTRNHSPKDSVINGMAKILKVDVSQLCEASPIEEDSVEKGQSKFNESGEVWVLLKSKTLEVFQDSLVKLEDRELEVLPVAKNPTQAKRLLEEALSLL